MNGRIVASVKSPLTVGGFPPQERATGQTERTVQRGLAASGHHARHSTDEGDQGGRKRAGEDRASV